MMLTSGFHRRTGIVAISILFALYLWVFLGRPYRLEFLGPSRPAASDLEPFNAVAIERVCAEQRWAPNVIFTCDKSFGGVGNLRNSILNCVRYSIAAGASLVMPRIILRSPADIYDVMTEELAQIDYLFDRAHFINSLQLACPQLQLYNHVTDIPNYATAREFSLLPESLEGNIPRTGLVNPENWNRKFHAWLGKHSHESSPSPILVNLDRSYIQYPIYSDGKDFALSFGGILRFRDDTRRLSDTVLQKISAVYSLSLDLSKSIPSDGFFGAHLRTEADAVQAWPPNDKKFWKNAAYSVQSEFYLSQALRSKTSVIFLANGNQTEVEKFKKDALEKNLAVTTKTDLLRDSDLAKLNKLAWDQQALVDYLVLLRATDFGGIAHSSFAWNIALKRHTYSNKRNHLDGPQMLSDEFSQIYGDVRGYPEYAACMWP